MFHHKVNYLLYSLLLLSGLLSACEGVPAAPNYSFAPAAPKYSIKGTSTKTPFQLKSTYTPTKEPPPTVTPSDTPTATFTPTSTKEITKSPTNTSTPSSTPSPKSPTLTPQSPTAVKTTQKIESSDQNPSVEVSVPTNCRTGPGVRYPKVSVLMAGKSASLVGRDQGSTYWVIKDPGQTGLNCWIWGYYATTAGNINKLSVYSAPILPSKKASKTPAPATKKTKPPATKKPKNTPTPKTPIPTDTPNLTPGTPTNTSKPVTPTPIPTNTSPPSSGYCSYTSVLTGEEEQIKKLINKARTKRGLPKLKIKVSLVEAARDHGRDMTCHGTYSHTSTDGRKAWERISVALGHGKNWCYNHCCCSEIFYGGGSYLTPEIAFDWWMNHPSQDPNYKDNIHKRTILSKYSTKLGVGVIYYQHNGTIRKFYTVDFAKPK